MQLFDTQTISERLNEAVQGAYEKLYKINESDWTYKPSADKWSKKEILGHLVDSAANNHIRFVRAQLADNEYISFAYEQDFFVSSQNHQGHDTKDLLDLWVSYNKHLVHVIKNADQEKLKITCKIGSHEPFTLGFCMNDYVDHLNHHLEDILK